MNLENLKNEYVKNCTERGMYPRWLDFICYALPIVNIIYVYLVIYWIIKASSIGMAFTLLGMFVLLVVIYSVGRYVVRSDTEENFFVGFKVPTKKLNEKFECNFNELMERYNINAFNDLSEKRLNKIVSLLNKKANKKYFTLSKINKCIIGGLGLIATAILGLNGELNLEILIDNIKEVIGYMPMVFIGYIILLLCIHIILKVNINDKYDIYMELAEKIEEYSLKEKKKKAD